MTPSDQNDVSTVLGLLRDSLAEEEQRIRNEGAAAMQAADFDTAPFHLPADERFLDEAEINRIVYRLFNLKAGEIAHIESSLAP